MRLGLGPLVIAWVAEHVVYEPPRLFEDVQVRGPFRSWRHRHRVLADGDGARLRDEVEYEAPGGVVAPLVDRVLIRPMLARLFRYRHAVTRRCTERSGA